MELEFAITPCAKCRRTPSACLRLASHTGRGVNTVGVDGEGKTTNSSAGNKADIYNNFVCEVPAGSAC